MLRQFVDEVPRSDERGILRVLAYGDSGSRPEGQEALRLLSLGFSALHQQLLVRIEELAVLTDHTMTSKMIEGFTKPYSQYDIWLFES